MDIQYHSLSARDGLFYRLLHGRQDTLVSSTEIQYARTTPPPYTRAKVRGDVIALARQVDIRAEVDRWNQVRIDGWTITLGDPLSFFAVDVYLRLEDVSTHAAQEMLTNLVQMLNESNPAIRHKVLGVLSQVGSQKHINLLSEFLRDRDQGLRLAAIEALGTIGGDEAVDILLSLPPAGDLVVRWRAQAVLDQLLSGRKPSVPRRPVASEEEPLVRLIG
jgi:hypothetical protein